MTMLRETWDKYVIARDLRAICSMKCICTIWCICACVYMHSRTNYRSIDRSIIFGRLSQLHIETVLLICARMPKSINQSNKSQIFTIEHTLAIETKSTSKMQFDNDIIFICSHRCLAIRAKQLYVHNAHMFVIF